MEKCSIRHHMGFTLGKQGGIDYTVDHLGCQNWQGWVLSCPTAGRQLLHLYLERRLALNLELKQPAIPVCTACETVRNLICVTAETQLQANWAGAWPSLSGEQCRASVHERSLTSYPPRRWVLCGQTLWGRLWSEGPALGSTEPKRSHEKDQQEGPVCLLGLRAASSLRQ